MNERQNTSPIDPAKFPTPNGFRRLEVGEILKKGDLFLHCHSLKWKPASFDPTQLNFYTNCIRPIGEPIALLPETVTA